jgi:hypothetical protein
MTSDTDVLLSSQHECERLEVQEGNNVNEQSRDISHSQPSTSILENRIVTQENKNNFIISDTDVLLSSQHECERFEVQESNNMNEQNRDISHSQCNISILDNRTVTQESKNNFIISDTHVLLSSQHECERFEVQESNNVNEQSRDISHSQSNTSILDNRIVTQQNKTNCIISDTDVLPFRDKYEQLETQNNDTSLNKNNVVKFFPQQQTTTNQKCESYLQNYNIVTLEIINNLSEEVSEMPFCSNENQHSEIPENNIFPPRVDNCSKDDNTATYQNEINLDKSLTISHYEFERSKSQNNINLDAPDKTRQESLHQKFGTALEINNGVIQENEINAIKSVECTSMCNKTSSKEEIKYH